jgi:colanic acid/amylovoran biosynthesis glycosyltransferase
MQISDLFLLPSVRASDGDEEGTPTVLMEAMACGLPVLSTVHSGIPELVEDGVSGWLVPERDVAALADRIQWMLDHPDRWAAMGRAGRAKVEREFNIDTLNDRLVELYRGVLAELPNGAV